MPLRGQCGKANDSDDGKPEDRPGHMKDTDSGGEPYASLQLWLYLRIRISLWRSLQSLTLIRRPDMLVETHSRHASGLTAARLIPALSAIALGFALLLIVGFASVTEVHNATHDTRHATGFPCH
jgi:cobalt transporter subunit CbtB